MISCANCILLCVAASLCACSAVPLPDLTVENLPTHWRNGIAARQDTPIAAWWMALDDPVLDHTVELALKQNLDQSQAGEKLQAARAIERATLANQSARIGFSAGPDNLARPLPEAVGTESSAANESAFRTTGAYLVGFDLNWELPLFGLGVGQRRIARAGIDSAIAERNGAQISITAEVVRVYGSLRAADEKLRVFDAALTRMHALDALITQAEQAGLATAPQRDAAIDALNKAEAARAAVKVQRESALQRLAVLCGQPQPLPMWTALAGQAWHFRHAQSALPALPARLIRSRPDVRQAEAGVLKAAGEIDVARADLYPKLSIEGALLAAGNLAGAARAAQTITLLAPTIRIPLLDWGLARDVVNAREAKLREAILAYRSAVLLAIEETETALAGFDAADARLVRAASADARLTAATVRVQAAFDAGYLSQAEAIRETIKLDEQREQQIDDKADWFTAFAMLNKVRSVVLPLTSTQPEIAHVQHP
jgi:outer membrane protein TolC